MRPLYPTARLWRPLLKLRLATSRRICEGLCKSLVAAWLTLFHRKSKSSSALVGYAAINGASDFRGALANYLSCDPSGSNSGATAIDIYGLND